MTPIDINALPWVTTVTGGATRRSFAAEVIADSSGKWCGNARRFATREAAEAYAADLAMRWTLVRDWRVVESTDAPDRGAA